MTMTQQQIEIMQHFANRIPPADRASFEATVMKALNDQTDRSGQRTVLACVKHFRVGISKANPRLMGRVG